MNKVLAIILGGGRGTRLYPLTKLRAKPAVPIAGKYRLIDLPVSNCINSGIEKIYVLTQFNSASLNRHIVQTYQFSLFSAGFVEILAAQQTPEHSDWFQGTADAVRHYLPTLCEQKVDEFLVLSGDHLYRMDFGPFLEYHRRHNADVTISAIPVTEERASEFGILRVNQAGDVIEFREKPKRPALLDMHSTDAVPGVKQNGSKSYPYIASMGIYVFKRDALIGLLKSDQRYADFSKEMIPSAVNKLNIKAYLFHGYWEDIGTIESFYNANMKLINQPHPVFDFYDTTSPIYTRPRFLPPSVINTCSIKNSMICDGCTIDEAVINRSIIGIRSRIAKNVTIETSLIMGADFLQSMDEQREDLKNGLPCIGIGENSIIRRAIIDKNARIGRNVKIINKKNLCDLANEADGYWISNGIVIIGKSTIIPDNKII